MDYLEIYVGASGYVVKEKINTKLDIARQWGCSTINEALYVVQQYLLELRSEYDEKYGK